MATLAKEQSSGGGPDTCTLKESRLSDFVLYMLRCGDGSLYTGITTDLEKRLALHQMGRGAKYVASRRPAELVYQEGPFTDKGAALRRELEIKSWRRAQKEALICKNPPGGAADFGR